MFPANIYFEPSYRFSVELPLRRTLALKQTPQSKNLRFKKNFSVLYFLLFLFDVGEQSSECTSE
jgi:hypothetical protein